MTLGEYRVGITFNPGGNETVNRIKRAAADLIDLCEEVRSEARRLGRPEEVNRLVWLAQDAIETAAMHAVKAATKPPWEHE